MDKKTPTQVNPLASAALKERFPALLSLAQGEGHDQDDCPEDSTCTCATARKLNAELTDLATLAAREKQRREYQED